MLEQHRSTRIIRDRIAYELVSFHNLRREFCLRINVTRVAIDEESCQLFGRLRAYGLYYVSDPNISQTRRRLAGQRRVLWSKLEWLIYTRAHGFTRRNDHLHFTSCCSTPTKFCRREVSYTNDRKYQREQGESRSLCGIRFSLLAK